MNQVYDNEQSLSRLFAFYKDTVKPLYGTIQADGHLPVEVLFEIHAAMDHVSRIFTGDQDMETAVSRAKGHLTRSCLDIFKLSVKEARNQYNELNQMRGLGFLDNGDFAARMRTAWEEIRSASEEARAHDVLDADSSNHEGPSFHKWQRVYVLCEEFRRSYYNHPYKDWAGRQAIIRQWKTHLFAVVVGAVVTTALSHYFSPLVNALKSLLGW